MTSTVSLRRFLPAPLPWDVRPVARLKVGIVEPLTSTFFPPNGPCTLILWCPGPQDPSFRHEEGTLERAGNHWRFDNPIAEGWVVHWIGHRRKP